MAGRAEAGQLAFSRARLGSPPLSPAWLALAWASVGAVAGASVAGLEPVLLEEGFLVHAAQRMAAGERLFTDVVSFTGPFPFELLALLFRLFGDSLWVPRAAVVLLSAASSAVAWAIGHRAGGAPGGHASAACVAASPVLLFPFFSIWFYVTVCVAAVWLATWAALRGTRSLRWAVAAGAIVAAVALSKQTIGVALAVTLLVAIAGCARSGARARTGAHFILGGVLVAVITVAFYALRGQLGAVTWSLVEVPLSLGEGFRSAYPNLWPLGRFTPEIQRNAPFYFPSLFTTTGPMLTSGYPPWLVPLAQFCFGLPPFAVVCTLAARLRGPLPAAVWIHFAAFAALCTNLYPRSDWGHVAFVLPSAAVQLVLVAAAATTGRPPLPRTIVAAALAAILALACFFAGSRLHHSAVRPQLGPQIPLQPVSHLIRSAPLARVVAYLRRHVEPGEAIFVARAEPLLYFATGTSNPTPFGGLIPGLREEQERAILPALESVRYVVMSDIDHPIFNYYADELPAVQDHLERYFEVPRDLPRQVDDWIVVLERRGDRGATLVDLVRARPGARAWERDEAEALHEVREPPVRLGAHQNRRPLTFSLGAKGGGVDFEIEVPDDSILQASVGYPLMRDAVGVNHSHPLSSVALVSVDTGEGFETVARSKVVIRSRSRVSWTPFDVDLRGYAGRRVVLRLELVPNGPVESGALAWWGSPRIVADPSSEAGAAASSHSR